MSIFYLESVNEGVRILPEEESKHCVQVLRHQLGDNIIVFDGNGGKHHSILTHLSKKECKFDVLKSEFEPKKSFSIHLGIAPTKNADRIEWMVEKLSEIGVDELSFIQTQHSERKKQRIDRLEKKAISAMKQSGNPYKLRINELVSFDKFLKQVDSEEKRIAHVDPIHPNLADKITSGKSSCLLIGPEGDFSKEEVQAAQSNGFVPVSLGKNTLRTETAGLIACSTVNFINRY